MHVTDTDLRSIYLTDYCNNGQKLKKNIIELQI